MWALVHILLAGGGGGAGRVALPLNLYTYLCGNINLSAPPPPLKGGCWRGGKDTTPYLDGWELRKHVLESM